MFLKSATLIGTALAIITVAAACAASLRLAEAMRIDGSSSPMPGEPSLAEIRRATERFRDINVALAEGYIRDPGNMCDTADMMGMPRELGAMGIHFFRPGMLGIAGPPNPRVNGTGTHTDFRDPAILIYEPQADGSLELVAVENLVFAEPGRRQATTRLPLSTAFHTIPWSTTTLLPWTRHTCSSRTTTDISGFTARTRTASSPSSTHTSHASTTFALYPTNSINAVVLSGDRRSG